MIEVYSRKDQREDSQDGGKASNDVWFRDRFCCKETPDLPRGGRTNDAKVLARSDYVLDWIENR